MTTADVTAARHLEAEEATSACWPRRLGHGPTWRATRHQEREGLWTKAKRFSERLAGGPGRATVPGQHRRQLPACPAARHNSAY